MPTIFVDNMVWAAIWQGSEEDVRRALFHGADPNRRDPQTHLTPLMLAAGMGALSMVAALVAAGADVNALDAQAGASALHKACQGGHAAVARYLVKAGAFVNLQTTSTGHTPLFEAVWFLSEEIVALLLEHGARVDNALISNYGFTLDAHLAYEKRVNTGQNAQEKLARIEKRITDQRSVNLARSQSPLLAAVRGGDLQAVCDLLAKGVDTEVRYPLLGSFDDGHTPLLIASRNGLTEIVRALLAAGADPNAVEPTFGAVPLHKATYNGHLDITRLLVTAPRVNLDYQGPSNGYTPLLDALWHGFADCAAALLDAGASPDLRGYDGKRALDLAREELGPDHAVTVRLERLEPKS